MASPARGWVDRLRSVLRRCGVPVATVTAVEGEIRLVLGLDGREILVTASPEAHASIAYKTAGGLSFAYRSEAPLTPSDLATVDLVVAVIGRLAARLPRSWTAAGSGLPPEREFEVRHPFARVERYGGPDDPEGRVELVLRLTRACNQDCPFCSAPPSAEPAPGAVAACLEEALRSWPGLRVLVSGGEPALSPLLHEALAASLAGKSASAVVVQTNAVAFASPSRVAALPEDPRIEFFVSFHGADEATYDACTGTRDQLGRARAGLRALIATGRRLTVNVVACSRNVSGLRDIVETVASEAKGLRPPVMHFSILMCPEARPAAPDWLVRYSDLVPALDDAVRTARSLGLGVDPLAGSTHASLPPCVLPRHLAAGGGPRPEPRPGETGYEDLSRPWVKAVTCRACRHDARCVGVPAPYARRFGVGELVPVVDRAPSVTGAGRTVEVLAPATASRERQLVALAGRLASPLAGFRLVLEVRDPSVAPALPGDDPLPASRVTRDAPPAIRRASGIGVTVRSRVGRPLCLFDDTLAALLLGRGGTTDPPPAEPAFGPACGGCALRAACGGVSAAYARVHGFVELRPFPGRPVAEPGLAPWQDRARWLLAGRPWASVTVGELLPAGALPRVACTHPWTRVELHGGFGPCCWDWMRLRPRRRRRALSVELLSHPLFVAYRQATLEGGAPSTCRPECPVLAGRSATPAALRLRGGSAARVENEIAVVEAMIAGDARAPILPLSVCFPVTSACNHDCLMCECGEVGTIADERRRAFYRALDDLLDTVVEVDANGGEPFLSAPFRAFVERLAGRGGDPVLSVVTNGSLLTPGWLERLGEPPFRGLVVSLNAATPETYAAVNRGVPFAVVRRNLDALLELRAAGRYVGGLAWSMVTLRDNLHEIEAFAEMAVRDGVEARFLLPTRNRNGQSVLTDAGTAMAVAAALRRASDVLAAGGLAGSAAAAADLAGIVEDRVARGVLEPL